MSRLYPLYVALVLLAGVIPAVAQPAGAGGRKQARAFRIASGAIRFDGRVDDEAWQKATPLVEFIQKEPVEGAAPSDQMEVRFVYDDGALYVGARMYSTGGTGIKAPMSRRDDDGQADYFQ